MASPSALTLPAAAPARHFPISRRGRRAPRRQHPTGPLGGRDVRPCAGARSAARSGRASIVARDGPGLTISTVMGRCPAPPRRGRSGRPSAMTCRRPGRARPRVWWMALSRWYPSGSRSTGWPPPRHSHYQPRHLPGTFLSAVGGGAPRAGSTQLALSGAGTFGRARAPGRRPVLGAPQS